MGFIDVLIPGVAGLVLMLGPGIFLKSTGDSAAHQRRKRNLRIIGGVLIGVAALYLAIKLAGH